MNDDEIAHLDDGFDDDAIRTGLLELVGEFERRMVAQFEEMKQLIATEAESADHESQDTLASVLARMEAGHLRVTDLTQGMRDFIQRQ